MRLFSKKNIAALIIFIIAVVGINTLIHKQKVVPPPVVVVTQPQKVVKESSVIIGHSVEGRSIVNYSYGTGSTHIVFVGGIHGGYEWNSVLLAYTFMDYLSAHLTTIPKNLTIDVIPSSNPDAVYKVTGKEGRFTATDVTTNEKILESARFNSNTVDLNRNFDCTWKKKSTWRSKTVSGGTEAFSEPETRAIRDFILTTSPHAVVFWHSKANGVYASQCTKGILPETTSIMNTYANASGYPAIKSFTAYETTGAADDWLASVGIPAVTVELKTHESIEWEQNLAGSMTLINYFKQ